ncbi:MAG TPA: hypothetical protein VLA61_12565 [Ideonella sp.]|uniref:hypothetical protein n=1 Tax=Ideonella sp. TaxID=1929293 RepID=UPI002C7ECBF5|nr:hypothetical protein [Ideonella sp.]HSI49097.1 hypothetical protein [Ideonella sp.]
MIIIQYDERVTNARNAGKDKPFSLLQGPADAGRAPANTGPARERRVMGHHLPKRLTVSRGRKRAVARFGNQVHFGDDG